MADSILGLIHNMKQFVHYKDEPFKLDIKDKQMLLDFLESEDVQKCIAKVPRHTTENDYVCPNCKQKLKWKEKESEKNSDSRGSHIFSNLVDSRYK